jgi:tetratricopeptide (TPR) repeat protein
VPALTACLIARDEEARLPDCLASLAGHVDEIVLVDTGSRDATPEIAARFGARVLDDPWRGDFAGPRNLGLDTARGDWILYIDADERLACPAGERLADLLPGPEAIAARVKFTPRSDMTAYAEHRLFRNDPRIRFSGAMHETVMPAIGRVRETDGLAVADVFAAEIRHIGYDGPQDAKHRRNLPLLERAVAADSERVYLRWHLGTTLAALGRDAEAGRQFAAGLERAMSPMASPQVRVEGGLCAHALAALRFAEDDVPGAEAAIAAGLTLHPENHALRWLRARHLLACGDAAAAIAELEPLAGTDPARFFDPAIAYERRLFGADTAGLLGAAHFRRGDYPAAADWFERAARDDPHTDEWRAKAALARARSDRVENPG